MKKFLTLIIIAVLTTQPVVFAAELRDAFTVEVKGSWNVDDGGKIYGKKGVSDNGELWFNSPYGEDYWFTADYTPTDLNKGGNSFLIRASNANNCYALFMNANSIQLTKKLNGVPVNLADTVFAFKEGVTYRVRVIAYESAIAVDIDGKRVLNVNDGDIKSGRAAFMTWQSSARLSDIDLGASSATLMSRPGENKNGGAYENIGEIYYECDFDNERADDWDLSGGAWVVGQIDSGEILLRQTVTGSSTAWLRPGVQDNITFESDYMLTDRDGGSIDFLLRAKDAGNAYLLDIVGSSVRFVRKIDHAQLILGSANFTSDLNSVYRLKVTLNGPDFSVYVNGGKLFTCSDSTFPSGGVAFTTWKAAGAIDNVRISEPLPDIEVTGISLLETEVSIAVGEQVMLTGSVVPENATDDRLRWTSSVNGVVSLTNGSVEGMRAGSTVITAATIANPDFKAQCRVTVTNKSFEDTKGHWARKEINFMASKGIINGADEASFLPEDTVTRAEFLALIDRIVKPARKEYNLPLTDVTSRDWYADTLQSGINSGLVDGVFTEGGKFLPDSPITREEMASMAANGYRIAVGERPASADLNVFPDKDEISGWAAEYAAQASELGILRGGSENRFSPKANATRAEAAVIAYRLYRLSAAANQALAREIADLEYDVSRLSSELRKFEGTEEQPREIIITKGIADMFITFAYQDLSVGLEELAKKEVSETRVIVSEALEKLKSGKYALSKEKSVKGAYIGEGAIYNENDEGLFLRGMIWINDYAQAQTETGIERLRGLGLNVYDGSTAASYYYTADKEVWNEFDKAEGSTRTIINNLYNNNMLFNVLLQHSVPAWALKENPELQAGTGNHFISYDVDNPLAKEYVAKFLKLYSDGLNTFDKDMLKDTLFSFNLGNEHRVGSVSGETMKKWRVDLQEKYGNIEALNAAWGKTYTGFDAIEATRILEQEIEGNRTMLYDFSMYSQKRFKEYYKWIIDEVNANTGIDFMSMMKLEEMGNHWEESQYSLRSRIDLEGQHDFLTMLGCDVGASAVKDDGYDYNMRWFTQSFCYDLYKSFAPDKPIYDSEWHALNGIQYRDAGIPRGYAKQALRMAAYHGMMGNSAWHFVRPNSRMWAFTSEAVFAQPYVVYDYLTECAAIEAELDERVLPVVREKNQIHTLYSLTSHIRQGQSYFDAIRGIYESMYFEDLKEGFVTERMLSDPEFINSGEIKTLIIPNASYLTDGAYEGLKALAAKGTAIIMVGEGAKYNQDGVPFTGKLDGKTKNIQTADLAGYRAQTGELLSWAGIVKPYSLACAGGSAPAFIEARFTTTGVKMGYAVNMSQKAQTFHINNASGAAVKIREFKDGALSVDELTEITLQPREVISFDIIE